MAFFSIGARSAQFACPFKNASNPTVPWGFYRHAAALHPTEGSHCDRILCAYLRRGPSNPSINQVHTHFQIYTHHHLSKPLLFFSKHHNSSQFPLIRNYYYAKNGNTWKLSIKRKEVLTLEGC